MFPILRNSLLDSYPEVVPSSNFAPRSKKLPSRPSSLAASIWSVRTKASTATSSFWRYPVPHPLHLVRSALFARIPRRRLHSLPRRCVHPGLGGSQPIRRFRAASAGERPFVESAKARDSGVRPGFRHAGQPDRGIGDLQLDSAQLEGGSAMIGRW